MCCKTASRGGQTPRVFPGRWGSNANFVHVCPPGCCGDGACADRAVSLEKAKNLTRLITDAYMGVPAMNKYTKVDLVLRKLCLLANFFGLMPRAIASQIGRQQQDGAAGVSPGVQDAGAAVGAPADEVAHLRKIGRLKLHAAHEFFSNPSASWKTMMWVSLCDPLMTVHYALFKYGTWYGHRVSDRVSIFDFCSAASSNPVVKALDALAGILFEPEQQASLTGLCAVLGGHRKLGLWQQRRPCR